jgi:eukaryotic-like serine/threonine-protein kinase
MKRFSFISCLVVLLLLVPAAASASTYLFVYSTPPGAEIYLDGQYLGGVTPREQNAMPGVYQLVLKKSGYADYTTAITIAEGATVVVDYDFTSGALNRSSLKPVLISVIPSSGVTNTTVSTVRITGNNFASSAFIRLTRSGYPPVMGSVASVNAAGTKITGSFDLRDQAPGDYQVCVHNNDFINTCGLTFTVTKPGTATTGTPFTVTSDAATNSRVSFATNPPGANIYLNNIEIGTSDFIYLDASPGTYNVLVRKTGYKDYSGSVTVSDDKRGTFSADLTLLGSATAVMSDAVPPGVTGTAPPGTPVTTMKKSPQKVPTTWPSDTPTEASPMDPCVVIGAVCLGFIILRIR